MTPQELLTAVRNYLGITWADDAGDVKLSGIIARGMSYLNRIAGTKLDYTAEDKPRELLFEYCRYVRSNALEQFQTNFQHELLLLQMSEEVKRYEKAYNADV